MFRSLGAVEFLGAQANPRQLYTLTPSCVNLLHALNPVNLRCQGLNSGFAYHTEPYPSGNMGRFSARA